MGYKDELMKGLYDPRQDIINDKRNLSQLTSGNMSQTLINAAYTSARSNKSEANWIRGIAKGVGSFIGAHNKQKESEKLSRQNALSKLDTGITELYESMGSLPTQYFDYAWEHIQGLRDRYAEAVANDDSKEQHKIKGELNSFSTYVGSVKTSLNDNGALLKDDDIMKENLSKNQLAIFNSCMGEGANDRVAFIDGTYKWPARDINGEQIYEKDPKTGEDKRDEYGVLIKKYYTADDLNGVIVKKDVETQQKYLDQVNTNMEDGEKYRNGEGKDFDLNSQKRKNAKHVKKENIQYLMNEDFMNDMTFKDGFKQHPDFDKIFNTFMTEDDGSSNPRMIDLLDTSGDGNISFRDFIDPAKDLVDKDGNKIDDPTGGEWTDQDVIDVIDRDADLKGRIEGIVIDSITAAITEPDHDHYDFETSKRFLVEYMSLRDQKMFYGQEMHEYKIDGKDFKIQRYKVMVPGANHRGNPIPGAITEAELNSYTPEQYVEQGGNIGFLKSMGWYYDDPDEDGKGKWKLNLHHKKKSWNKPGKFNNP